MTDISLRSIALFAALACAWGASSQALAACPSAPGRFATTGAEVTDTRTGLVWQRCSAGQAWSGSTCTGAITTFSHEQALAYGRANAGALGWRVPDVKELSSLADRGCASPTIDTAAFPGTALSDYWSSTPYVRGAGGVLAVNFDFGLAGGVTRGGAYHVRLVRSSP